jgi:hypothetical protein
LKPNVTTAISPCRCSTFTLTTGELSCRVSEEQKHPDVTFVDAAHDIDEAVDAAYRAKYRRCAGSILNNVLTPEARATTIKLVLR